MFKYFIIIFLYLTSSTEIYSQMNNKITSVDPDDSINIIDKKMEILQTENNWDKMISLGRSSVEKGYDSFFLRARLGIAYYETQDYLRAIPQLEKALLTGVDNPTVLLNLYYCYLYTGREEDKNYIFAGLPERVKKKLKPLENIVVDNILFDFGLGVSNDINKNSDFTSPIEENTYTEQILNGNISIITFGLNQIPLKSLNVNYIYTYLKLDKIIENVNSNGNFENNYSEIQNRFYNSYNIRIAKGLVISPAGHFIGTEEEIPSVNYVNTEESNFYGSGYINASTIQSLYNSFVLSAEVSKYTSALRLSVNGSFSYLNKTHQSQYGLSFKFFPTGKVSLYSKTDVILQNQNSISNLIFNQTFGGVLRKKLFYEIFFTVGKINNFNEKNGFLIYNNPDRITFKAGLDVKYYLSESFGLNFIYSFQNRERNLNTYSYIPLSDNFQPVLNSSKSVNYQLNNFAAGFKFIF